MIRFSVIHRAKDSLALSASTDIDTGDMREPKLYTKLLSKKSRLFPVRSFMKAGKFNIFFTTDSDICFLMICEAAYSSLLAFSFLEDLKQEFLKKYTKADVDKAIRPYSFIEFDSTIQKTKQKYNSTRTFNTRVNFINEMNDSLEKAPPHEVKESELGSSGVYANGTAPNVRPTPVGRKRLQPMTWVSRTSLILTALCALLNIIRIVPYISDHEENEHSLALICVFLLLSAATNLLQCYILLYHVRGRPVLNWALAVVSVFLLYLLNDLRSTIQVAFHLVSTVFVSFNVWRRTLQHKLPNYNV